MPVDKLDFFIAYQIVILAFFEPLSASSPKMKILPTPGSLEVWPFVHSHLHNW